MDGIIWKGSPNHYTGRQGYGVTHITLHIMVGYLAGTDSTFANPSSQSSAHYGVGATGEIHQYVAETDGSYSDANYASNCSTISIEHANNGSNPWTVHEKAIESGAHLVAALCLYYGLGRPEWCKNVFPHRYWSATACPGELAGSQRDHYMQRAQAWYDAMKGGKAPAPVAKPAAAKPAQVASGGFSKASGKRIPVHYSLHLKGGGWLDEVTDFGAGNNGFAGYPCRQHDLLCARVDRGTLKYQVHTIEDGWLGYVTKGDRNDTVNGCAGIAGHTIDGVRMYYATPGGEEYKQAWPRWVHL